MTKIALPLVLGLGLTIGLAQVQDAHADSTGCGLGTTVWKGESGVGP